MFLSFIKSFFVKRKQVALEREQRCDGLVSRFNQISVPETFDNKNALKNWLDKNADIYTEVVILDVKELRKTKNYQTLVANKDAFLDYWSKIKITLDKIEYQEKISALKSRISQSLIAFNVILKDPLEYANETAIEQWRKNNVELARDLMPIPDRELIGKEEFFNRYSRTNRFVSDHNKNVHAARIEDAKNVIGRFGGNYLDEQQLSAVIDESASHLVLAGAGTGKTTTIVGKVKYLLKKNLCKSEEILLLAYNAAAAKEMSERLTAEIGFPMQAYTFHKFGKGVIAQVENRQPTLCKDGKDGKDGFAEECLKNQLQEECKNPSYMQLLMQYLTYSKSQTDDCLDFKSQEEYEAHLKENPIVTLKKEKVKSYGEMTIANFLYQNGIRYEYEATYSVDTNNAEYGMYRPDFYLPDYKIYIEYFGINREGRVPAYFESRHSQSATANYQSSMDWKRKTHKENGTVLVECFAYEKFEGTLLENLKKNLIVHNVAFNPISMEEMWNLIRADSDGEDSLYNQVLKLFCTLLKLTKSNDYDVAKLYELNEDSPDRAENLDIIKLFEPLFNAYCAKLAELKQIDFDDMINRAAKYIRQGDYKCDFKYVIVDEYQDISKSRFNLVHELRNSCNCNLFCVGDDWQSIYRFSGSDVSYILNFEKYWGKSKISYIETTYRFPQRLIEASGSFIMENPEQIKKSIKTPSTNNNFALAKVSSFTNNSNNIRWRLNTLPKQKDGTTVFFIGRYNFDKQELKNSGLEIEWDNVNQRNVVKYAERNDLKMTFITAHASKGLQADYVFILNNKNARQGFPSKIKDPPIMKLLLEDIETFDYAEERRLFYVAMTRAKKKVFFVLPAENKQSCFFNEIEEKFGKDLDAELWQCPACGGRLRQKQGRYGLFIGCENYRQDKTGCNYTRKSWERRN
ncbi:MAG: UvrD-helicase domain-containing protein [Fibrobacteraceae bacterium]|nr:UvrD-helicase domain-containing protein [Fibrobacteraceae bacterium]